MNRLGNEGDDHYFIIAHKIFMFFLNPFFVFPCPFNIAFYSYKISIFYNYYDI